MTVCSLESDIQSEAVFCHLSLLVTVQWLKGAQREPQLQAGLVSPRGPCTEALAVSSGQASQAHGVWLELRSPLMVRDEMSQRHPFPSLG